MAGYSLSAALNILNQLSVYPEYQGVSGLTKLLADTSISVPWASSNAISLLYSGMLGDTRSSSVARAISAASGGAVITVDQTQQGQLLSSSAFQDAFKSAASAAGYNTLDAETLMGGGTLTDGTRVIGGLWSNTSVVFTENASSIITITPTAGQDSVFYQFELASAVDKGIPINGIPAADLRSMPLADAADVVNSISLGLVNQLKIATNTEGDIVGLETGSIFPTRTINTLANAPAGSIISTGSELLSGNSGVPAAADSLVIDPFASSTDNGHITGQNLADFQQGASSLSTVAADGVTLESLAGKGLTALGVVAIGYTFYEAEQTAQQQAASGNSAAAEKTMMDWTVTTVGGITGGALAAEYAAPLLLGGPVGWIGYGALVFGGGIAGSIAPSATQHLLDALTDSSSPVPTSQTTNADGSVWNTLTYTNGIQASQLTYSPPGITLLYQDTVKVPDGNGGYTEVSASISSTGIDTKTSVYALADGQSALQSTTTLSADALGNTQEVISNGLGNPTEIIYDATQNGGGDTQTQSNLNSNGQIENSQSIDTQTSGSVFDTLSGMGAVANLNGAEVSLADGSSATVIGSNNSINAGAGSQTTINGSTDIVAGGVDDTVTVLGTGENITLGTGSTLVMTGTDEEASLSNGTVWLGANTTLTGSGLTGSNDVLNVSQNDSVVENGKDDTVNLSSGDSLVSNGGGNNIINAGVDDTVVIDSITAGYTDTVNATGDQSITLGNDVSVDVVGSGNTIFVAGTGDVLTDSGDTIASSNASMTIMNTSGTADLISGSNDTITANHSSISFSGMDEVLSGVYDTVGLETGSSLTLSLYDDTLNLSTGASVVISGGVGSGNIINAGVDDVVVIDSITAGYTDTVNATGDQSITLGNDVSVDVVGGGNTIFVAGTGDVLADSGDTIASSNVSLTIMNTSGAADLISGDGDTITANHSSISFGGVSEVLSGVYDTVGLETGSSLTLSLYDDTLNLSSGASVFISGGVGSGNIINAGVDDIVDIDSMTAGYTDTVNATGDQSITLGSDVSVDVVGSGNTITANGGDSVSANGDTILIAGIGNSLAGAGDTISSSNVSLTIMNTSGAADLISGDGDTITASHSSIMLSGVDEVMSGSYDTIGVNTGSSVTLTNYDDTINLSSGASLVTSGGGGNIINAGVDSTVYIGSTTIGADDTVNATGDQSITLGSDVSVDVVGSGNTILVAGTGDVLSGSGDTISSSNVSLTILNTSGTADLISGNNDTITANHSSISFSGMDEVLSGNYDTVGLGTGSSVTLTSYDETLNVNSGASVVISGGGNNIINAGVDDTVVIDSMFAGYIDTVNATDDQGIILGSDVSVDVVGAGNTITVNGGDSVSANGDTIQIAGIDNSLSGSGDTISSSNGSLTIMNTSGAADLISGNSDTITANHSSIMFGGVGEVLSGNYDTVGLGTSSSVTLTSYDDSINLSSGAGVVISGGGNNIINAGIDDSVVINSSSDGYANTVNATGDQNITLGSDVSVNVVGSGNTILVTGTGDVLTDSGDTVSSSNISLTIMNTSGTADFISGNNDTITTNRSSIMFGGVGEVMSGNYDTVGLATGSSVTLANYDDTVNMSSGASVIISGGGNNIINAGVDDTVVIDNSSSGYTETVNATGDQGITLGSDVSVNVVGSGNTVAANGGDSLSANGDTILIAGINNSLTGSGNTITSSNISLAIVNASAVANTITGDHDVIAVSHSVLNLNGSNEVVSGNDDVITVAHGESVIISGAGNTVTGSSDRITLSGDNSSLTIQGNGDNLTASGVNDRIIDNRADGSSVLYGWNSSGTETETVYSEANDGGQIIGGYGYSGPGIGVDVPVGYGGDDGGDGGDGGGYGFAGDRSLVSSAVGKNIGAIAQYDLNHANLSAADAAEVAQHQVQAIASLASTTGAGSAVLEGAKFDQQVITWSLADTQGTQAAQFSGYMGSADESVVQGAFNTWAAAMPGVTFKEVADSAQSDIRLGFGDFNTATTGVIGYTSYQANDGQIEPDAIVRVEDSAQDALTTGADGQQIYAGTDATLSQVLLHEIGHALGLGDNADQNSVMNYQLTTSNRALDRTDLGGIGSLYGAGASTAPVGGSGVSQLIQAMSTFNADAGVADTALLPASLSTSSITLAATSRAA